MGLCGVWPIVGLVGGRRLGMYDVVRCPEAVSYSVLNSVLTSYGMVCPNLIMCPVSLSLCIYIHSDQNSLTKQSKTAVGVPDYKWAR